MGAAAERTKLMSRRVEREIEDQAQDAKSRQQIHPGSKTKTGAEKKKSHTKQQQRSEKNQNQANGS
jgi:hypothetical protein